jgi:AcrR family transcriptional regulator
VPRPRKHTDDELVAAAARAVAARGPQALTLADVAAEAGLAPATLVQRFGSKRGLLLAVAASGADAVRGTFATERARRRSPLAALESALVELSSLVSDPDEVANHLAFLALDLADPEFRELTARHTAAMGQEIEALLREAAGAGDLPPRSVRPLADLVQAAYHGALLLWAIDRRGTPAARLRSHLRLILRGPSPR